MRALLAAAASAERAVVGRDDSCVAWRLAEAAWWERRSERAWIQQGQG